MQASLQRQRAQYGRELATVQTDYIQNWKGKGADGISAKWTERACGWFPLFADAMRMERYCRSAGFTPEQTDRLFTFQPLEYSGNLYSEEHKRALSVTGATAQMGIEQGERGKRFVLRINGKNILDWFREQFERLLRRIRPTIQQPQRKTRDSNCNDYKYLCANIKMQEILLRFLHFHIFAFEERKLSSRHFRI